MPSCTFNILVDEEQATAAATKRKEQDVMAVT
jgi:hypothetical protein